MTLYFAGMEIEFDKNYDELTSLKKEMDALKAEMVNYIQGISEAAEIPRTC